jgi:hypothetical protein
VKRWWADWVWSDEFKWSSALKESTDVWIHINNWDDLDDWYLSNKILKLTKNRLWPWVWCKINYLLNINKNENISN